MQLQTTRYFKEKINKTIQSVLSKYNKNTLIIYNISPDTVHKLVIPPGIENLSILGYHLDHFDIPECMIDVRLGSLGLKTIYIPEGVKHVFCSRNFLKTIEIPTSLEGLVAHHNILSDITFRSSPNKLNHLDIHFNKIKRHRDCPIMIYDKATWNQFFDRFDRGYYPWTIIVMTSNVSPDVINHMDPSFIREGRVNQIFHVKDKDKIMQYRFILSIFI